MTNFGINFFPCTKNTHSFIWPASGRAWKLRDRGQAQRSRDLRRRSIRRNIWPDGSLYLWVRGELVVAFSVSARSAYGKQQLLPTQRENELRQRKFRNVNLERPSVHTKIYLWDARMRILMHCKILNLNNYARRGTRECGREMKWNEKWAKQKWKLTSIFLWSLWLWWVTNYKQVKDDK